MEPIPRNLPVLRPNALYPVVISTSLKMFIDECCDYNWKRCEELDTLKNAFDAWCTANDCYMLSHARMRMELDAMHGIDRATYDGDSGFGVQERDAVIGIILKKDSSYDNYADE